MDEHNCKQGRVQSSFTVMHCKSLAWIAREDRRREDKTAWKRLFFTAGDDLTGAQWMLSIEGQVVVPPHPNFVAGIAALFASYYNFNLLYQEQASCTLEFIQRCFIGINPTIGKKGGKVSAKKSNTVNPHVCTLLKCLMDFEWLSV
ncbi:hypothetical protein AMEX_G84 [Astyanax mexicanus]|uniref:Uncharacterized protein n=1 Tax=Astyanax mexicanus TaxID=7994 RepID=A0A8T2L689_ASTMX|nr:hypothetical protein AMEX_G22765 [Astyanax mexicanus]KAG9272319.1 hypothetical protein AMEX_G13308 [Astyanax mexicanus]KAG9281559.1 hypothetical protein AMEX_G84 [Astyanax mexicanus]